MPRTLSSALASHIAQDVTSLAWLWRIDRPDGQTLGFTSADRDLVIDDVTYEARSGASPTTLRSSTGSGVDNSEIGGTLSSDFLTELDLLAGRYDGAKIEVAIVNHRDLSQGKMVLIKGFLGEVSLRGKRFSAEARSLLQRASQNVGSITTPGCRVRRFGDSICGVNLAPLQVTTTVSGVNSRRVLVFSALGSSSAAWGGGTLEFLSGALASLSFRIKKFTAAGTLIELQTPLPVSPDIGSEVRLTPGCDRTLEACKNYNNVANFQGEPYIPGTDAVLRLPVS